MPVEMARYFAHHKLRKEGLWTLCAEHEKTVETKAGYDDLQRAWVITYAIDKLGFQGAEAYVTVDSYGYSHIDWNGELGYLRTVRNRQPGACPFPNARRRWIDTTFRSGG
jgi:hypothetical protein